MSAASPRRGDIFWADLGPVSSSAPAKHRPVLVIQSDAVNRSQLATVVIAALTSNTALAEYPGNVFLPASVTGLPRDSVLNVTAVATVDREALSAHVTTLPRYLIDEVRVGLRLVLDL